MSVLIKGMEMPKCCADCPIGDTLCCSLMPGVPALWKECLLVPVPPHGRLIDADDFIKRISELVRIAETDGFDLGVYWYTAFMRHIEIAPTIIPAEEAKDTNVPTYDLLYEEGGAGTT